MLNMSVREKYPSTALCKRLTKTSAANLDNETLKLELDQMIIKELIDQNYKILHRNRLHLENVPSPGKVNFTFHNENRDNTEENLDEELPFINTQKIPSMKSKVSFNNPKSKLPLILNN